ncbi:hypothetical protein AGDE_14262 [Angomonas deanei]|nr:hypothetical protein AGDE_14262 [Angomonas deanei]|eukprot:EPY21154.1 hypothetical protein AGDE_14262 [Angomonas deanei]
MSMDGLINVLEQALSPDNAQRKAAEAQLEAWSRVPGFYTEMCSYACQPPTGPVRDGLRLMGLSIIKRKVSVACSNTQDETTLPYHTAGQELLQVLHQLFQTVSGQTILGLSSRFQNQLAATVAQLMFYFEKYSSALPVETSTTVLSAISTSLANICAQLENGEAPLLFQRVLVLFTREVFNSLPSSSFWREELLSYIPVLFGTLNASASFIPDSGQPKDRDTLLVQLSCVKCLRDMYEWFGVEAEVESSSQKNVKFSFTSHAALFRSVVSTGFSVWATMQPTEVEILLLELLVCYNNFIIDVAFIGKWAKQVFPPEDTSSVFGVLQALFGDTDTFTAVINQPVSADDLELLDEGGDDGDDAGVYTQEGAIRRRDVLLCRGLSNRWDFLARLLVLSWGKRLLTQLVMESEEKALTYLQLLTHHAFLPERDRVSWSLDVNLFLRQEGEREDQIGWSTRDIVTDVFVKSCQSFGPVFLHASLEHLHERLFVSANDEPQQSWKEREVSLLFIGSVVHRCHKQIQQCGGADFAPLTQVILDNDVVQVAHPVLVSRGMATVGCILQYMQRINDSISLQKFCGPLVSLIRQQALSPSSQLPFIVRASACQLLQEILPVSEVGVVVSEFFQGGYASLLSVLDQEGVDGEFLYLLLDILVMWVSLVRQYHKRDIHNNFSSQYANAFEQMDPPAYTVMFRCWRRHMSDPNIADCIVSLFGQVVKLCSMSNFSHAKLDASLLEEMTWMKQVLQGNGSDSEHCAVPFILRMLHVVFREGTEELAAPVASSTLNSVAWLIFSSDESAVLQAGSTSLCSLLRRCPPHMVSYPDVYLPSGGEGQLVCVPLQQVLVRLVCQLLADNRDESSLLNIGNFLVTIVENGSLFSQEEMTECIRVIVSRLQKVKTHSVGQQLLAPLVVLLRLFTADFLRIVIQMEPLAKIFTLLFTYMSQLRNATALLRTLDSLVHCTEPVGNLSGDTTRLERNVRLCQRSVPQCSICIQVRHTQQEDAS